MSMYLSNADVGPTSSEPIEFLDDPVPIVAATGPERSVRTYVGPGITVYWDGDRCIHSERCTAGAPTVFDRSARPWVHLDDADPAAVAKVIDTCPSGALTYTRTDGEPHGRRGRRADEDPRAATDADADDTPALAGTPVTISPQLDGPLLVAGAVGLTRPDGSVEVARHPTLCRCGHSNAKPRCDGSHITAGFRAPGVDG